MAHDRKIVVGGVALTKFRNNRHCVDVAVEIMNELELAMIKVGYLDTAPFKWVGLMLRFGIRNEDAPHYGRINKEFGDLPVAIELDTHELQHASRETLKQLFMIATLKTLVDIAKNYNLPGDAFARMLEGYRFR